MGDHIPPTDGTFINSIIGEGTRFQGELVLAGLLRIDGDFKGSIKTDGKVLVGKNGRAECTINARTVVVGGVVRGDIYSSEKVIVLSTGLVIGNISAPRLMVEEGVILNGSCVVGRTAANDGQAPAPSDAGARGESAPGAPGREGPAPGGTAEDGFGFEVGAAHGGQTPWNR